MYSFLDMHHHILFGIDDGPINRSGTEKMLQVAYKGGARTIIATPHIVPGVVPYSEEDIRQKVRDAQILCQTLLLDMEIYPGAEVMYTCQADRYFAERRITTMAGSSKVLIEFMPGIRFDEMEEAIQVVLRNGYVPVIAHIERYSCLKLNPLKAIQAKKKYDVQYQINCDHLLGGGNVFSRQAMKHLLLEGQIDYVASDAHNTNDRAYRLHEAYEKLVILVGREYADELTGNHQTIADFFNK